MKYRSFILTSLLWIAVSAHAQFVDIEWSSTDTLPPCYTESFQLGADWQSKDYSFLMHYTETEPATEEEILRYKVDVDALDSVFRVNTYLGVMSKQGCLDVSVYPFARYNNKVYKLISFKPVVRSVNRKLNSGRMLKTAAERYASHSLLSSGRWVKIRIGESGVYQLTKSQLSKMGFADPAKVKLYGYGLPVLPEADLQDLSDDLTEIPLWRRDDGTLLFYGSGVISWQMKSTEKFTHFNNPYSNYNYYFLTEGDSPKGFTKEAAVSGGQVTSAFPDHVLTESDGFSFINSGRQFFEAYDFAGKNTKTYKLSMPGYAGGAVTVDFRFVAAGSSASNVSVSANGTRLGTVTFRKLNEYEYGIAQEKTYTWTGAKGTNDSITVQHTGASGVSGHLDYIRLSYMRNLAMTGGSLLFRPSADGVLAYQLTGAAANTRVWRVTIPADMTEITGSLADATYSFSASSDDWRKEQFVAVNIDAEFPEPQYMGAIENQDLHSLSSIDYVIVVPANGKLTAQAQRLADAHTQKEGLRCVVVRADQIYNEFSSGTPDITAYRRFLKMLYDRASTDADAPKNICLFGDGVWDNRMVTSGMAKSDPDDYLLCYESDNSISHTDSYVMEEYIALLDDGEGARIGCEKPDCGVGRITVTTVSEAQQVVDKLIGYINNVQVGAWKNTICMMADDANSNIHMSDAEAVTKQINSACPDINIRKIYWDSYQREQTATGNSYPGAVSAVNSQMQDGALVMNYTGHGAYYCLSHEQVMKRSDFAEWSSPRLPLWVHAACDVSPFDMNTENIGETALLNKSGAAMGLVTTTRTVYSSQNRVINLQFMKYVLAEDSKGRQYTIGEALQHAKAAIVGDSKVGGRDSLNKMHFVLLGDPAIRLASPTYKIVVDTFNGSPVSQSSENRTIGAGAVVTLAGHIEDEDGSEANGFSGLISPTVYDNLETVECRNNAGEDVTPFIYTSREKKLYSGTDSVMGGRFSISFPVPLDINYSDESGLVSLYAVSGDHTIEANGRYEDFILGGTDSGLSKDTIGPELTITLNGRDMILGVVNTIGPTNDFFGLVADSDGVNTTGNGIGHDITLMIDNDPTMTYNLNQYFEYDVGSWSSGSVSYTLPTLETGYHTILFRAWDILNNQSTVVVNVEVVEDGDKVDIYDLTGRRMMAADIGSDLSELGLPKGVYILKTIYETKKYLIK